MCMDCFTRCLNKPDREQRAHTNRLGRTVAKPACNLYNRADLPLAPFRTDEW